MIDPWVTDWLNLLIRWFHLVVGAAWIGTSFYFNWLNNNVRPVDDPSGRLAGGLWSIHGGAFYQINKYKGAPEQMPEKLHWFKYEAYLTWISGVCLLIIVYWMQAGITMVPPGSDLPGWAAALIGIGSLVLGWVVYDLLCRSPIVKYPAAFAGLGLALMTLSAFVLSMYLSPRAAYIHVGAMMGTMMALNVFFVIIPSQRKMVDLMVAGKEPPADTGKPGSQRSLHNNYFTLPVLFIMISNHFPFTYAHTWGWVVLVAIAVIGAGVRHWFNLHGKGQRNVWILPVASVAMIALAFVVHGPDLSPAPSGADVPSVAQVHAIIKQRCVECHSANPTSELFKIAPKDVMFDTPEQVQRHAPTIKIQAVSTTTMPLGNLTEMTDEERAILGRWIDAGAPLK
jgi:uncharacterized membrane protein